jgi:hypothetical protein
MIIPELAKTLEQLGCPVDKASAMAAQLSRRAKMDAEQKGIAYEAALSHLLGLMAQGWAMSGKRR